MIASPSPVMRIAVQAAAPLAVVVAVYLLFAGHNRPGGGFAAGLVIGAVVALRTIASLQVPARSGRLMAAGVALAGVVAVLPLLFGEAVLDQVVVDGELPVLGKVKAGTALPFDIGVALVVVGLVAAVLEGLGGTELAGPTRSDPTEDEEEDDGDEGPS